ncbi:MAG TPA: hypothetical protein VH307_00765 [Streptosporangiaceae bacterium]|nr:hypothetical protein [Streptosporangiaceae bacterium]
MVDEFPGALVIRVRVAAECLSDAIVGMSETAIRVRERLISGRRFVGVNLAVRVLGVPAASIVNAVAPGVDVVIGVRSHFLTSTVRPVLGVSGVTA